MLTDGHMYGRTERHTNGRKIGSLYHAMPGAGVKINTHGLVPQPGRYIFRVCIVYRTEYVHGCMKNNDSLIIICSYIYKIKTSKHF